MTARKTRSAFKTSTLTSLASALLLFAITLVPREAQAQSPTRMAEVMPEFPGGQPALTAYVASNVSYPEAARKAGAEGTVYVHFVVAADGSVTDVRVPRPVDPDLEAEAMRVVKTMPTWKPGQQAGAAVPVLMTLPVAFKL
ncbi:MAG: energy transducer TonB [Flavobacteriales bacterium]|nr:energy transducer TonB [Flavobacteriales bacterium]